ncbi:MAG: CocE/NonD family hydrolase, partial [Acidobacteria bacterium]|nr:CocE/NonD family hydrolase [Acidobacteriota bacterium]
VAPTIIGRVSQFSDFPAGRALVMVLLACAALEAITVERVLIPMRDGVRLAADVYHPKTHRRRPVLIARSPYNRRGERKRGEFFAQHGYVFVAQDVRGSYESGGVFEPLVNEGRDGYDTIEWAARQRWANGKVGTTGASYLGMDQFSAAIEQPPHLAAMWIAVAASNFFEDTAYVGGTPSLHWPTWILDSATRDPRIPDALRARLSAIVKSPDEWLRLPPRKRLETFDELPRQAKVYREFYDHPRYDEQWKRAGLDNESRFATMKDVPIYLLGGWYDDYSRATVRNFHRLRTLQKSMKKLEMGPWPHGYGKPVCGDARFGPEAALDETALQLDWFDHCLRGKRFRVVAPGAVRYFRMGGGPGRQASGFSPGGAWQSSDTWPPRGAVTRSLFLGPKNGLAPRAPLGTSADAYSYDPAHPFQPRGGRTAACIVDQKYSREDLLTYQTEPLTEALDASGPVRARLFVTSDGPDTDFTARLIDVYPDGYAMPVAEGRLRTSYRNGNQKLELLTPGEVYEVVVELGDTSNLFAPGHRLRLDVSSSAFPRFEPNPNTGERAWNSSRIRIARNAVWRGGSRASAVELTVVGR